MELIFLLKIVFWILTKVLDKAQFLAVGILLDSYAVVQRILGRVILVEMILCICPEYWLYGDTSSNFETEQKCMIVFAVKMLLFSKEIISIGQLLHQIQCYLTCMKLVFRHKKETCKGTPNTLWFFWTTNDEFLGIWGTSCKNMQSYENLSKLCLSTTHLCKSASTVKVYA